MPSPRLRRTSRAWWRPRRAGSTRRSAPRPRALWSRSGAGCRPRRVRAVPVQGSLLSVVPTFNSVALQRLRALRPRGGRAAGGSGQACAAAQAGCLGVARTLMLGAAPPRCAGAWAEMEFDTESGYSDPTGNATDQQAQVWAAATMHGAHSSPQPHSLCARACSCCCSCAVVRRRRRCSPPRPIALTCWMCHPQAGQPQLPAIVHWHGHRRPSMRVRLRVRAAGAFFWAFLSSSISACPAHLCLPEGRLFRQDARQPPQAAVRTPQTSIARRCLPRLRR